MKTNANIIWDNRRFGARKEQKTGGILKAKTELCTNCNRNAISPFETDLCDFCADDIRFRPILSDL